MANLNLNYIHIQNNTTCKLTLKPPFCIFVLPFSQLIYLTLVLNFLI
jgi:hypothetical protein